MTLNGAPGGEVRPGGDAGAAVLVELFRSVLASTGVKGEAADRVVDGVMTEYRKGEGACTVRFAAHAGEIEIAFSRSGRDFRVSCPVPVR
jgi:hypothetical protein